MEYDRVALPEQAMRYGGPNVSDAADHHCDHKGDRQDPSSEALPSLLEAASESKLHGDQYPNGDSLRAASRWLEVPFPNCFRRCLIQGNVTCRPLNLDLPDPAVIEHVHP